MHFKTVVFGVTVLFAGTAGGFDFGSIDLGKVGEMIGKAQEAVTEVDEPREIELGTAVSARLLGAAPLVENVSVQRYVNQVGLWVARHSERPSLPWRFGVIDTDSINAFAAPGGYVFITRGLFMALRDEAELAGVLGHEIVHVLRRHHLNAIQEQARMGLAADVASIMARQDGRNIDALVNAGMELYTKGLDREDEFEADRDGVVLAQRAGYAPDGLRGVLVTLDAMGGASDALALLFKTHPAPADRLEALDVHHASRWRHGQELPRLPRRLALFQQALYESG
ncbi:MAG: M48 family metalloprotease [Gammaproteobacteria bacterium]|nr:M48 family metalloprotease [Gammaproteobacteria bacterium]